MNQLLQNLNQITNINLNKKRIFLRADLNVPIKNKTILQDYRLEAILPTIDYIQKNGGKIILATHIGRPNPLSQTNFFDENLSTKIIAEWFAKKHYVIDYEIDLQKAIEKSSQHFSDILLLENLRFFNGEISTNIEFAQFLSQCADVYINDAFGTLHRNNTSITLLPKQFNPKNRTIGLLVKKEIEQLTVLKHNPKQPFIVILGGNKIKDKIEVLDQFLEQPKQNRVQTILIGGAIANTFLKSKEKYIGKSLIEEDSIIIAHRFLEKAKKYNVKVLLPIDVLVAQENSKQNPLIYTSEAIAENGIIVDIGPQTTELFKKEICKAKTIFANGTMGIYTEESSLNGSYEILSSIAANINAVSIIGGGDCVAATYMFKLENKINFLSTGGGATLKFLSSKYPEQTLPGLKVLMQNT